MTLPCATPVMTTADSGRPSSCATPCARMSASEPARPPVAAMSAGLRPTKTIETATKTLPTGGAGDGAALEDGAAAGAEAEAEVEAKAE